MRPPAWLGRAREWRRDLAAAVVIGSFLGVIGPFGSFLNGGVALRIACWTAMALSGVALYGLGLRGALHLGRRLHQPAWFAFSIGVGALAVPMSLISAGLVTTLWPSVRLYVHPFDWYAQTLAISLPVNLLWLWARRFEAQAAPMPGAVTRASPSEVEAPPLLLLGQRLVCLQMEDHYVRIHTDAGSRLVLSPLKAAIDALPPTEGLQVHRSWWVARDAVVRAVSRGRQVELELSNGLRAPVSRASVARLRAAGWLAPAQDEAPL